MADRRVTITVDVDRTMKALFHGDALTIQEGQMLWYYITKLETKIRELEHGAAEQ